MQYQEVDTNLYLLPLAQPISGFRNFISSWLYRGEEGTFLVDPGPLNSVKDLVKSLGEVGVRGLDYILLTHIHIDHAGGTGALVESFPGAKVICHPKGIRHLLNPAQLWKGSKAVLGDVATAYGEIVPVPQDSIFSENILTLGNEALTAIETPGHAPHHLCFMFKQFLFAGEVTGIYLAMNDSFYSRPATPPPFRLEISLASLEKVISIDPEVICYGHYGINRNPRKALQMAKHQFVLWTEEVDKQLGDGEEKLAERVIEALVAKDEFFANYRYLESDVKERELYFIKNSIGGIRQYLETKSSK
jgi:glyoxylase-like metal-dependent hydrolase (beta-lactamase superfamily II)